ncbi:hypothetical protein COP1_040258 [Malus domestica]
MYVVGCGGLMICFSLRGLNFRRICDSGGGFDDFEGSWPAFMVAAAANWVRSSTCACFVNCIGLCVRLF